MLRAAGPGPQAPTVRHRRWAALLAALVFALSSPLWLHSPRAAAATSGPCAVDWLCVGASTPPSPGSTGGGGGGGGGANICTYGGKVVDCSNQYGALDPQDGCYYMEVQPQPPAGDPLWAGHAPGAGAIYLRTCSNQAAGDSVEIYLAGAPPVAQGVNPGVLARQAWDAVQRGRPVVRTAPGGTALVGAPIWLWIERGNNAWAGAGGKIIRIASKDGIWVKLEAWSTGITWNMGDGGSVGCTGDNPGTPYNVSDGSNPSPDCGYTYRQPSANQPGQLYAITATVAWHVHWSSNVLGFGGDFDADSIAGPATTLRVDELQVLNQPTKNS
ncbi:hypothetical protein [Streptacidiphilus sp. EB103A]|uniref:hypothetical protein n=1 Tax=Streptacidiphilus sp. EB103A TaxID=3156275 RepID=UPI0035175DDE